jgi:hypothetical protein
LSPTSTSTGDLDPAGIELELAGIVAAPGVTHLTYRAVK